MKFLRILTSQRQILRTYHHTFPHHYCLCSNRIKKKDVFSPTFYPSSQCRLFSTPGVRYCQVDDSQKDKENDTANSEIEELDTYLDLEDLQNLDPSEIKSGSILMKFNEYVDDDSTAILDIVEEMEEKRNKKYEVDDNVIEKGTSVWKKLENFNLDHGKTGVFDVEELVAVLQIENATDVVAISVPTEMHYVDYIVIASCKSPKHLISVASFIKKLYKVKKFPKDPNLDIEGLRVRARDWIAADMGNIVLHLFRPTVRHKYDLEMLWSLGSEYDRTSNDRNNFHTSEISDG